MRKTSEERFLQYLPNKRPKCDCWEWTGALSGNKYGAFWDGKNQVKAHRYSYEYFNKTEIKNNYIVMHTCDNMKCVNPQHLVVGTPKMNSEDSVRKGRNARGEKQWSAILTEQEAIKIMAEYQKPFTIKDECKRLAIKYGVTWRIVQHLIRGTTWKHLKSYRELNQNLPN
jgi:hypothetical protein